MAKQISRARAIQSGILQVLGGVLILAGVLGGGGGLSGGWTSWLGLGVSIYFAATGGYRTVEAFKMPKD